ncbi:AMP-binding protein [Aeromicrobium yanjiei]|uniref:AMP-binding protein n=1 Tax=Aeromicrobium yanjiei TaxID=2662028 RepID=UPI001ABAEE94|nr:AMP-binding protein [Aeromicrobium yanjiei]
MTAVRSATLAGAVLDGAAQFGATRFVVASEVRPHATTVGELVEEAKLAAGALQGLGVGAGDVVAVQLPNWYEGAVLQTAAALVGAVVLPIVQIYERREVEFIVRESRARVLVIPGEWRGRYYPDMLPAMGSLPDLEQVVVIGDNVPAGALSWDDLLGPLAKPWSMPVLDPRSIAMLVYTSGTTADPKGVQHSHESLLAEVWSDSSASASAAGASTLAVFPSGHVAGLLGLLRVLVKGAPTVTMDVWDIATAARLIDEHRVTFTSGAPVHLSGLLDAKDNGEAALETLKEFLVGGASVSPSLIERADRAGVVAYRCYGSSEHPTVTVGRLEDSLDRRANTDGPPIAGSELRIVDDNGVDVAPGEAGNIVTRGAELFVGYRDTSLDAEAFLEGGWFITGDIGTLDQEGYLTVTDRKKDIIVRGGENISSKEVEDVLATHPDVADVAVVGAPDERLGERVAAFVIVRDGKSLELSDLAAHCAAAGIAKAKTPELVRIVQELPRTAAGKIRKVDLRNELRR